jgi:DNA-binding helix-hairpin-helix protein with protein kinase domain
LFLPPELKGADLRSVVRTKQHDLFGLAVILFKLLMLGRHPFAGRFFGQGDMTIERAIEQHRFVYGANAARYQMKAPPSTIRLDTLPLRVADLFEQAFAPPSPGRPRPTARAWSHVLDKMAKELVPCPANPSHYYDWESARCPWCELERAGITVFAPSMPTPTTPTPSAPARSGDEAEFHALVHRAAAVPAPSPAAPQQSASIVLAHPAAILAAASGRRWLKPATVILALGVILAATPAIGWLFCVVGCAVVLLGAKVARPPKARRPWIAAYRNAKRDAKKAEATLRKANAFPRSSAARTAVEKARNQWADIGRWENAKIQQVHGQQANEQRRRHLESHRITPGQIPGIGDRRVDLLAARGIRTAADIAPGRIAAIPGFGPAYTGGLTSWRRYIESRFAYDPTAPASAAAVANVSAEAASKKQQSVAGLRHAVADLETARAQDQAEAQAAARDLSRLLSVRTQAQANLRAASAKRRK